MNKKKERKEMNKEIPVFFAVDNGYIPFLGVALKSLIDNTSKENKYAIKILYTSVTEENKKSLDKESVDTKMYRSVYDRKDQELTID